MSTQAADTNKTIINMYLFNSNNYFVLTAMNNI